MIGKLNPNCKEVTIVGGGVSGLLAAYYLTKAGYNVQLFEAGPDWGGLIQTSSTPLGMAESAAHSILVTSEVEKLFHDLNISLLEVNPGSKARWIVRDGRMKKFPLSLVETLQAFLRASSVQPRHHWNHSHSPSLTEWTQHHLGSPSLEYLINPMLRGIFGVTPDEILAHAAFPSLRVAEGRSLLGHLFSQRLNRPKKSKARMMAPKEGMGSLIHGLKNYLEARIPNQMHLNCPIQELPKADNLILALPPQKAADLLKDVDSRLAESLRKVRWAKLVTTTVFLEKNRLGKIPQGVGVLMPAVENRRCLGILFNSSSFAHRVVDAEKWTSVTVMTDDPNSNVLEQIHSELSALFGWDGIIEHYAMTRWPRAIPLYDQNLVNAWELARSGWCHQPGHVLAGNATGEVSIRGMIESTAVHFDHPLIPTRVGSK